MQSIASCSKFLAKVQSIRPHAGHNPATGDYEIENVKWMLAEMDIEPAQTEWTTSIVYVPKKYASIRFLSIKET